MPGKGKHRRPKANPVTRGLVAAGTGSAAIALPLLGATGANAATPAAAPQKAAPASVAAAAPAAAKAPKTYTVVAGDYLAKIAEEQNVRGGWKRLYNDNRRAIGADPALIHPGLELTINAKSKAKKDSEPRSESKPRSSRDASRAAAPAAAAPAAEAPAEKAAPASSGWTAPVGGGVSTPYRASGAMWSSGYHTGVDFIAGSGTSVKSVGPGTVVSAGWSGSYGNEVVIQHGDGTYSQYAHLSSLSVSSGQSVSGGEQIGLSGSTGNSTGPHLHFEIRTSPSYGSDIDPLAYLRQHGVSI
ncbi:peptidoglycan DD-metalloendopeptidase family protein [Streptomyces sp. PKU-EA00015]|uniref:M23 family metallopeptidase n=1 Tax=Streptomyces sp. PKU-EA00015 TaxID=2748326 RepID=UPI0015A1980E|nr:LysM peptidoglycan-binding domain-containing M23 family metallopeptidase [Streptomyces sp. PKU-EA00015]NWF24894.1 peptidoglycan DD-metalloendopeptidase family protein [Streptomyces sp. PKU-EA00015]